MENKILNKLNEATQDTIENISENKELARNNKENRRLAREQGNIKRENEKQKMLKEKGNGYYWDKIKSVLASIIWFVPSVIAYALHGRILVESTEPDIEKDAGKEEKKEKGERNKEKENQEKDTQDKAEQEKKTVDLKDKKLDNCGLQIVDNELKIKGTDKNVEITAEMLKDNDISDKLSIMGIAKETNIRYIKTETMEIFRNGESSIDINEKLDELDKRVFDNKLNVSLLIGELRSDMEYVNMDNKDEIASFVFNDVTYTITKDEQNDELMLSDEDGNKVSISNTSQEDIYKWVKTYNDKMINIDEAKEIFTSPEYVNILNEIEGKEAQEIDKIEKGENEPIRSDNETDIDKDKPENETVNSNENTNSNDNKKQESTVEQENEENMENDCDTITNMFEDNPEPDIGENDVVFDKDLINNELDEEIDEEQSIIKEGQNMFGTAEGEEMEQEYEDDEMDLSLD